MNFVSAPVHIIIIVCILSYRHCLVFKIYWKLFAWSKDGVSQTIAFIPQQTHILLEFVYIFLFKFTMKFESLWKNKNSSTMPIVRATNTYAY